MIRKLSKISQLHVYNSICQSAIKHYSTMVQYSNYKNCNTTNNSHDNKFNNNTILGCVFDMDGTLTQPHLLDIPAIKRKFKLTHSDDLIDAMLSDQEINDYVVQCEIDAYSKCALNTGYFSMIEYLEKHNIHKAILTRSTQTGVDTFLQHVYSLKQHKSYTHTLTREYMYNNKPCFKPNAQPLLYIMQQWQLQPSQCLMIGDSIDDIRTGNNACVKTVLLKHHQNQHIIDKADYTIDSLDQLIDVIEQIDQENNNTDAIP